MQFRNKLLSGVMASAAIFGMAGTADAVEINVYVSQINLGDTTDAGDPLPFAEEVDLGDEPLRGNGGAYVSFDVETGTFPSGNVIMQLQLNGATFDGALSAGNFDFLAADDVGQGLATCATAPTANVSIGGADGANTVTFLLSNLNNCADGTNPAVFIPFLMNGGADVSMQMTILTESGNVPVDQTNNLVIPLVELADAYTIDIDTATYTEVVANVSAAPGPYLQFVAGTTDIIGDVEVFVDTDVVVDLGSPAPLSGGPVVYAATTDVDEVSVAVTGNMAAYSGAAGGVFVGGTEATIAGSTATIVYPDDAAVANIVQDVALNNSDEAITLDSNNTVAIQASPYSVTVNVDFAAGFTDDTLTESVLPVTRNGTTAKLPWTASNTQAGGTGSNNFIRVSNPTGDGYGPITVTVLAASTVGAATVGDTATLAASLGAGEEVVFSAADVEGLIGNFGRADLEISVEGEGAIIARLVQRTDGTYEINNR